MRFRLQIDGLDHQITAGAGGELMVDANRFEAKVTRPSTDRVTVQVGDTTYDIRVIDNSAAGTYLLELAGERIPVGVTDVSKVRSPASRPVTRAGGEGVVEAAAEAPRTADPGEGEGLRAPMPGRIVDVLVKPGDMVDAGTVLVILEAMKMENELRAPKRGAVGSVLVKKGDPAEGGQLLVTIQ